MATAAKKPIVRDIDFTLSKTTTAHKVVSTLQERFKPAAKTGAGGKTVNPRKPQGRQVIGLVLEAVLEHASPETLATLADEVKDKGEGDDVGKASKYIAAIASARASAPVAAVTLDSATEEQLKARLAAIEAAKKAGGKTKDVAAL